MLLTEKLSYLGVVLPNLTLLPPWWKARRQPRRFAAGNGLEAHWHETWPEDPRLATAWNELVRARPSGTAFQSPAWQEALARPYVRAGRFRLLTISEHLDLVGALPLQLNPGGRLETLGSMISDYLEPPVDPHLTGNVWDAICYALLRLPGVDVNEVTIHNVRRDALDFDLLCAAARRRNFDVALVQTAAATRVALAPTWDAYLGRLGGHDRKEIRRKLRKAVEQAGAELVTAKTETDVTAALENVFEYMRQAGGSKGAKARWTYRPMFKRIARPLLRAGQLQVHTLRLEGRDAAGLICFPGHDGPLVWAAGFDHAMSKWSPGIVLFAMTMQRAIAQGATCFDLLRGQQRYKSELGAVDAPVYRVTLRRR
jgi:CelD/BcsL family acetyltransferase involved in cellulose biosynthesis